MFAFAVCNVAFHITRVYVLHVCVVVCCLFACSFVFVCSFCMWLRSVCRCLLQSFVAYYTCVYIACVLCFRVLGLIVCECMIVMSAIAYVFAVDCCNIVFHVTRVFI